MNIYYTIPFIRSSKTKLMYGDRNLNSGCLWEMVINLERIFWNNVNICNLMGVIVTWYTHYKN